MFITKILVAYLALWLRPVDATAQILPHSIPSLQFLYNLNTSLGETISFGPGPKGERLSSPITGGTFTGPRLSGKVLAIGSDWGAVDAKGTFTVDAYYQLLTDDGANIFVHAEGPEQPSGLLYTHVTLETGDERYYWVNNVLAFGIATSGGDWVSINAWELVDGS